MPTTIVIYDFRDMLENERFLFSECIPLPHVCVFRNNKLLQKGEGKKFCLRELRFSFLI